MIEKGIDHARAYCLERRIGFIFPDGSVTFVYFGIMLVDYHGVSVSMCSSIHG